MFQIIVMWIEIRVEKLLLLFCLRVFEWEILLLMSGYPWDQILVPTNHKLGVDGFPSYPFTHILLIDISFCRTLCWKILKKRKNEKKFCTQCVSIDKVRYSHAETPNSFLNNHFSCSTYIISKSVLGNMVGNYSDDFGWHGICWWLTYWRRI